MNELHTVQLFAGGSASDEMNELHSERGQIMLRKPGTAFYRVRWSILVISVFVVAGMAL